MLPGSRAKTERVLDDCHMYLQLLSAVVNDRQSFAELTGDKEEVVGSLAKETLEQSDGILFETHLHY